MMQAWRGTASDRARVPQHAGKIILGALLSRTLGLKIARLILNFNLVFVPHAPPPKKKRFTITYFETTFFCFLNLQ